MNEYKQYLLELRADPRWMAIIKEILKLRPEVHEYHPGTYEEREWKYDSAKREGFDIWYNYFFKE